MKLTELEMFMKLISDRLSTGDILLLSLAFLLLMKLLISRKMLLRFRLRLHLDIRNRSDTSNKRHLHQRDD